jgi:hypothetical protein
LTPGLRESKLTRSERALTFTKQAVHQYRESDTMFGMKRAAVTLGAVSKELVSNRLISARLVSERLIAKRLIAKRLIAKRLFSRALMSGNPAAIGLAAIGLAVIGLAVIWMAPPASAQEMVRVRGTIESVDGPVYLIKTRDGAELKLSLTDKPNVVAAVPAVVADIKPGSFIGSAGTTQPDGTQKAIEVSIFPEAMRGAGEGHYDWDLKPQSKMTNANVEQTVKGVDGEILSVKYKGGEKKLLLTPETIIVAFVPGDGADLKPSTHIFVPGAKKQPDGSLQSPIIIYGKDGLTPPM